MASPYSSGGDGSNFENRVVVYYLAAILREARARGVLGKYKSMETGFLVRDGEKIQEQVSGEWLLRL